MAPYPADPRLFYQYPRGKYRFDTPERRDALTARRDPYWLTLACGRHLGFRKSPIDEKETWHARIRLIEGRDKRRALGPVRNEDDGRPKDGLTYWEAVEAAQHFFRVYEKRAIHPVPPSLRDIQLPKVDRHAPYTVAHAVVDYLKWLGCYSASTRSKTYSALANIIPPLGHIKLSELKPVHIAEWMQDLATRPARQRVTPGQPQRYRPMPRNKRESTARKRSVNVNLTILKAALNRAYALGYVDDPSPWKSVKAFKLPLSSRSRYLTKDECRRLLNALPNDLRNLVQAALLTGCRAGELLSLQVGQFAEDPGKLVIHETKTGRSTAPTLTPEGVEFFRQLSEGRTPSDLMFRRSDGRPWTYSGYQRGLNEASEAAGITPPVTFHVFRHTYASHALMSGIPATVVARQLGHIDTRMVEQYYGHIAESYVDQEVRDKMPTLGL